MIYSYCRDDCTIASVYRRGKSGHRRTGCRLITGEGDFKESATETDRLEKGKGGKAG